ncbi:pyridoxamine 5'-phosphate oxidase [Marinibactrum halimedae]|uniref:Pyridoxine/pyridoxamine 5'-phosphate oxidase n=1 Tax=Marinibactrum halimedae TaxID=1444977 RepID=A0AA37WM97_9GAMM|nr:pyridoxamine 5'-phosphate oxidase [Marinibactrum halimedae]MCD9457946.1 pyridoxamine 5'-phosphate oxidase [Marinibactrum halimedae]GLS26223.1 pyridoxine/pyridoxamine 5'-phosphate oxidase [Marinibactrum halimedae]
MSKDIQDLRREYTLSQLTRESLLDNPVEQFQLWLKQAIEFGLKDPTAMTVATVDEQGQPSQRIVLLKHVDDNGFVFYTNYSSRKAEELGKNPKISLHFPWHAMERQVKVCGVAEKVSAKESLAYFSSRPKESQLAAWASAQSRPISSRTALMQQFARMKEKFAKGQIPLPDFWGGYRVQFHEIEFWQGGSARLHDRFVYQRRGEEWSIERLMP